MYDVFCSLSKFVFLILANLNKPSTKYQISYYQFADYITTVGQLVVRRYLHARDDDVGPQDAALHERSRAYHHLFTAVKERVYRRRPALD